MSPIHPTSQADLEAAHEKADLETVATTRPSLEAIGALKVNSEIKLGEIEVPFKHLSRRRLEAIAPLLGLIAIAQLPLFTVSGSLANTIADIGGFGIRLWLPLVHSLAFAAVAPFAGHVSDLVGRRYLALASTVVIIVGMVVLGTAHQLTVAIIGMAIAGMGGGIGGTLGIAAILEIVPVYMRGRYLGTVFLLFLPMGPSVAYAQMYSVTQTWRWSAWIPLIIAGVVLVLLFIQYRPPPRPATLDYNSSQLASRIDYLGGFLYLSGTALLISGLILGGFNFDWDSAPVISTVTIGGALFIGLAVWQRFASIAMLPGYLFSHKYLMFLLFFIIGLGGAGFYCIAAFWQLEIIQLFGPDGYHVARILTPFGMAFLAGVFFASWALDFTRGRIREIFLISSCMMTAGIGGMLALTQDSANLIMALSFIGMFGVGALFIPPIIVLTTLVPENVIGTIVGLAVSFRLIIGQAGFTLMFNLLQQKLITLVPPLMAPAIIEAGLPKTDALLFIEAFMTDNLVGLASLKPTPAVLEAAYGALSQSYLAGFQVVYYCGIGFGGAAIIASVFLPNIREYLTDRVVVDIH